MQSPIRYYGSKGGFKNIIIENFPNPDTYDTYVEAYGGGASVLFSLEGDNIRPIEIYNDINQNVYSIMKVLNNPKMFELFKKRADLVYHSRNLNKRFKDKLKSDKLPVVDRAFMFWYVTRTSFNGLGGYNYDMAIRRKMSKGVSDFLSSVDKLYEIHNRLSRVVIENMDGLKLLQKQNKERVFAYLDPPYHLETRTSARYESDMTIKEQEDLVDFLLTCKSKVLLSGYHNDVYKKLEDNGWQVIDFEVKVTKKNKGDTKTETLWKNY